MCHGHLLLKQELEPGQLSGYSTGALSVSLLQRDGGALKIYSTLMEGAVATVEPLLDRVVFFWSDRRNPHAVMPAFRERSDLTETFIYSCQL